MIPHPDTPAYTSGGFGEAHRKARTRRLRLRMWAWLWPCYSPAGLDSAACFGEVRGVVCCRKRLGLREVEVAEIVGSVGRCRDFDRSFMPLRRDLETRWNGVCRALCAGKVLPPVSLYKVDAAYFVRDGNHRVSVSRYRGVQTIEAEVVELVPVGSDG